ncbi:glycosyltransferase, MGT family [Terricaulis silvestris]|uniref:Glycosyltransferase, MGT family n=2 Tax=Terricaulis silvestris TaxID=2686094 RepID=A0A6I6MTC8_9CAUL|nr:glycosyltransferase, MGT family [Terricaulis silvestris]
MAVADEARRRGHDVSFLVRQSFVPLLEKHGFSGSLAAEPRKQVQLSQVGDTWTDIAAYLGLTENDFVDQSQRVERKAIKEFKPDAVFVESNVTMPLTCLEDHIPLASTFTWADTSSLSLTTQGMRSSVPPTRLDRHNDSLQRMGVEPIADLSDLTVRFAQLILVPMTPSLEPELSDHARFRFVGDLLFHSLEYGELPAAVGAVLKSRPRVYVYLGTSDLEESIWVKTLQDAVGISDLAIVAASREHEMTQPRLAIQRWLPGGGVMSSADICLHAGTANTMMLAVRHGVPQMLLPFSDSERRYHAEKIVALGAGVLADKAAIGDASKLCVAIHSVLDALTVKQASVRLRDEAAVYAGPRMAVDMLEAI